MFNWLYDISSGLFLHGGPCEVTPGSGQSVAKLHRNPKPRTERYDGVDGIRQATAQEISDYDAAQATKQTAERFDSEQLVKALAIWTAQKLGIPLNTARQEILAILRGL